jgi:hypothetical protein
MSALVFVAILMFAARLLLLRRMWQLPRRHGEGYFMGQRVGLEFYREAGYSLLRRYRISLLIVLLLDAPFALWLYLTGMQVRLALEQVLAVVVTTVVYNLMAYHFSYQAAALAGPQEHRPATVQLSMTPRRLRDHLNGWVELTVMATILASLILLARSYVASVGPIASHGAARSFRAGLAAAAWVLYWQIGLLLLKGVFVRWRMPLPANRTEDFRRWRALWLNHNLKIFDAVRVFAALVLLATTAWINYGRTFPRSVQIGALAVMVLGSLLYLGYVLREGRILSAAERDMKPIELVKEFPSSPVAQGRYLAGGLLYFNRENPGVVVRSFRGIAINLARPTTYAWAAYFLGLVAMMTWMGSMAR